MVRRPCAKLRRIWLFSRGLQRREELLASGYTELELQQLGADKIEAARRGDPLGEPPVEVKIADPFGEEGKAQGARRRLGLPTGHTQCERRTFEVALAPGKVSPFTQPMTRPSTEQMVGYLQSRVGG
jgi:hypothetical protein